MWYFQALNRRISRGLTAILRPGPAEILDAGCGTGGLIRHLTAAAPNWKLTGLDVVPRACELARKRTGSRIVEGSVTDLPFGDGQFDATVMADVLCQVEDPLRALRECARVTRPSGVLVVTVPAYRWLWSYHDMICQTRHRYTRTELVARMREAGFDVAFAGYANLFALPFLAARRKWLKPKDAASDVRRYPLPVDRFFAALAGLEALWLHRGVPSPAGSSVFVFARKPASPGGLNAVRSATA